MEMGSVTILLQLVDMWYQLWSAEDINQYDCFNHRAERVPSETGQLQLGNSSSRHFFRQASSSCLLHALRHALVFFGHRPKVELIPKFSLSFVKKTNTTAGPTVVSRLETKKWAVLATLQCLGAEKGGFLCQVDRPKTARLIDPLM